MTTSTPEIVFTPALTALLALELVLLLGGCVVLALRLRTAPLRFLGLAPSGLPSSALRPSEMFLAAACIFAGAIVFQQIAVWAGQHWFPPAADGALGRFEIVIAAGFQFGMLAGIGHAWFWHLRPSKRAADAAAEPGPTLRAPLLAPVTRTTAVREGFFTFLTLLPIVGAVSYAWQNLLGWLGVEAPPQDLVKLFAQSGSHLDLAILIVFAVLIAPPTEELIFRVGLFRWLRGRTLRTVALLMPAFAFAAFHGNLAVLAPLTVFAVCLSLAYERVGHPLTPMVAHALFNLNTIALVLCGLPT